MILLASQAFDYKSASVLHIVLSKDYKNPAITSMLAKVKCDASQIFRVGETLMTDARFNHFKTIIIHDVSMPNFKEYLKRLSQYRNKLYEIATSNNKTLVVVGNSVSMLGSKITYLPITADPKKGSFTLVKSVMDLDSAGLNITVNKWHCAGELELSNRDYVTALYRASKAEPLYCLDSSTILQTDGQFAYGKAFKIASNKIEVIAAMNMADVIRHPEATKQREVDMTAPQEQDSATQAQEQAAQATAPKRGDTRSKV